MGVFFFFQAEDGIRDGHVTGVQTCALPICDATQTRVWVAITFSLELSHVTTCWVAKESTRLKHAAEKLVGRHALSPDSAPSPREPPLRRAVATTPARPRAAVPRRARRALAATSARAHRCPSIGRPSRGDRKSTRLNSSHV